MKMKKRQSNSSIVFKVLRQVSIRGLWIGWKTASLPHVANDYANRSNSIKLPCEMAWRLRNIRFNLYDNRISDCRHSSDEGFIWPPSVLADWYWYGNKCRRRYGKWRIIIIGCRFGGTLSISLHLLETAWSPRSITERGLRHNYFFFSKSIMAPMTL